MMLGGRGLASPQLSSPRPKSATAPITAVAKNELCRMVGDTKSLSNGGPEAAEGDDRRAAVACGPLFTVAVAGILPILRSFWEMRCEKWSES